VQLGDENQSLVLGLVPWASLLAMAVAFLIFQCNGDDQHSQSVADSMANRSSLAPSSSSQSKGGRAAELPLFIPMGVGVLAAVNLSIMAVVAHRVVGVISLFFPLFLSVHSPSAAPRVRNKWADKWQSSKVILGQPSISLDPALGAECTQPNSVSIWGSLQSSATTSSMDFCDGVATMLDDFFVDLAPVGFPTPPNFEANASLAKAAGAFSPPCLVYSRYTEPNASFHTLERFMPHSQLYKRLGKGKMPHDLPKAVTFLGPTTVFCGAKTKDHLCSTGMGAGLVLGFTSISLCLAVCIVLIVSRKFREMAGSYRRSSQYTWNEDGQYTQLAQPGMRRSTEGSRNSSIRSDQGSNSPAPM
jgi:hypothetical protein